MPRKLIVDSDLGVDDALGLCLLLFHPELEVLALTATEGVVSATQANSNLQAIVAELDPSRHPRLGMAMETPDAPPVNTAYLYGEDGLGNAGFEVSHKQHLLPAEKVIIETIRKNPGEVTFLALGPLTNLARALRRDPAIAELIDQVVMVGGTVSGVGNVTPAAEFNFYFDPASAQQIFRSRVTKWLIPLDVLQAVHFGLDFFEHLPGDDTRAGYFLRQIFPHVFRTFRQQLGRETITVNDAVGALAAIDSSLFEFQPMGGDVEIDGSLTRGATIFDRRSNREWRDNLEVAVAIDATRAKSTIADLLKVAGRATS